MQASPVGFAHNEELGTIDLSGYRMSPSQKFRNVAANLGVAFVVDDIASRDPWRVRCLEVRGTAEQAAVTPTPNPICSEPTVATSERRQRFAVASTTPLYRAATVRALSA